MIGQVPKKNPNIKQSERALCLGGLNMSRYIWMLKIASKAQSNWLRLLLTLELGLQLENQAAKSWQVQHSST